MIIMSGSAVEEQIAAPGVVVGTRDAAQRLGISEDMVLVAIHKGHLPGQRVKRRWLVPVEALEQYRQTHLGRKGWSKRRARDENKNVQPARRHERMRLELLRLDEQATLLGRKIRAKQKEIHDLEAKQKRIFASIEEISSDVQFVRREGSYVWPETAQKGTMVDGAFPVSDDPDCREIPGVVARAHIMISSLDETEWGEAKGQLRDLVENANRVDDGALTETLWAIEVMLNDLLRAMKRKGYPMIMNARI